MASSIRLQTAIILLWLGAGWGAAIAASSACLADLVPLPDSQNQLFRTYGLFIDEQSSLLYRDSGRAWGAIGGAIAILGMPQWDWPSQVVVHASANANFRLNPAYAGVLTETIDARAGIELQAEVTPTLRLSIGYTHFSGHAADSVVDPALYAPNLGDESLPIRVVYDWENSMRIGATFAPVFGSDPGMLAFSANQFAEWYPLSSREKEGRPTPYLALGLEEYGNQYVGLSGNAQVGTYLGGHLVHSHHQAIRTVLGYYSGADPALKYAQFKASRVSFGYLGAMFDF